LEQRRQTIAVALDSTIFAIADPTRVAQIVGNLLHNAAKFTAEGEQIEIHLARDDQRALIRVVDDGVGIAAEQLAHVFDMFTRVERSAAGTNGGLGIGLALSRKLAEMHEGELTAQSAGIGKGSTFILSLPAAAGADRGVSTIAATPNSSPRRPAIDVVVIEDNRDSAAMLALSLESRGFVASVANNGPDGLALVLERRPPIILCDIGLPEMDGLEVCRRVRQLALGYRPVMIALTGWGMKEDVQRTQESGFDHHLVKPIAPESLFELLERLSAR
jgi:CheY-like chemotaxis protein/anti-sigma regulatory factor (Ser/Thr protein kinase)